MSIQVIENVVEVVDDQTLVSVVPEPDQVITLAISPNPVTVVTADPGPQGPPGPQGSPGAYSVPISLTDGPTIATDCGLGSHSYFRITLGGNRLLANPTNVLDAQKLMWEITQDSTGGRTLTFGSKFDLNAVSPILSTDPLARDFLGAIYNSNTDKFYLLAFRAGL